MKLRIVKYGEDILRQQSEPVSSVTPELVELAESMLNTMHTARGVGLAAQQVGRREAVCVIDVPTDCEEDGETREFNSSVEMPLVMFNPVVIATDGEQRGKEGCLSFPNVGGTVTRPAQVTCQYIDETGAPRLITVRGFLARAVMHETDHLNGILYIDHMTDAERQALGKRLKKVLNGKR